MRSIVDLPQPEGPTSTMNSPSAISRLKSSTATTPSSVTLRLALPFLAWRRWPEVGA